ncbi:transketolase [Candidatus Dependentiae bacterium]|nr:transketolase [Candidatus Dependentiae bacterium]
MKLSDLKEKSRELRKDIIKMLLEAKSGHPGGSLSAIDILTVLYYEVLKHNSEDPNWEDRDKFVLAKGHINPALYAVLANTGYFPKKELLTLRKLHSRLQGHPDRNKLPCIEASTGSLGQGLSIAVGMAVALKHDNKSNRIYCMMGDGEQDEGQIWEAVMSAAHYGLDNLCGIVDCNGLQIDGWVDEIMSIAPIADRYKAFGWRVIEIDGHNFDQIRYAFRKANQNKKLPTVIIANTVKGHGVSFMEDKAGWHGRAPNAEEAKQALKEIEELEL